MTCSGVEPGPQLRAGVGRMAEEPGIGQWLYYQQLPQGLTPEVGPVPAMDSAPGPRAIVSTDRGIIPGRRGSHPRSCKVKSRGEIRT